MDLGKEKESIKGQEIEEKDKICPRETGKALTLQDSGRGSKNLLQVPISTCSLVQAQAQGYHVGKTYLRQEM